MKVGIDFGTSNSVVANFQYGQAEVVPNHEGMKWTPSVVTLRRDGTLAFGQEARGPGVGTERVALQRRDGVGVVGTGKTDLGVGHLHDTRFGAAGAIASGRRR